MEILKHFLKVIRAERGVFNPPCKVHSVVKLYSEFKRDIYVFEVAGFGTKRAISRDEISEGSFVKWIPIEEDLWIVKVL